MKFIDQIENTINYDKSIDEQLACLSQFDNITEEEILELTFHFKSSEVGRYQSSNPFQEMVSIA